MIRVAVILVLVFLVVGVYLVSKAPVPAKKKPVLDDDYANMPEPGSPEWESWLDARIKRQDGKPYNNLRYETTETSPDRWRDCPSVPPSPPRQGTGSRIQRDEPLDISKGIVTKYLPNSAFKSNVIYGRWPMPHRQCQVCMHWVTSNAYEDHHHWCYGRRP